MLLNWYQEENVNYFALLSIKHPLQSKISYVDSKSCFQEIC